MTRLIAWTITAAFASVAAFAASDAMTTDAPEVIEIEVSADELASCQKGLREAAEIPAVTDAGTPIFFDRTEDMPRVACVVTEA